MAVLQLRIGGNHFLAEQLGYYTAVPQAPQTQACWRALGLLPLTTQRKRGVFGFSCQVPLHAPPDWYYEYSYSASSVTVA